MISMKIWTGGLFAQAEANYSKVVEAIKKI